MDRPIVSIMLFASVFLVLHGLREFLKPYSSVSDGINEAAQAVEKWGGIMVVNLLTFLSGCTAIAYIAGSFVIGAISQPLMYTTASLKLLDLFDEYLCLAGYRTYGRTDYLHARVQRLVSIGLAMWVTVQIIAMVNGVHRLG